MPEVQESQGFKTLRNDLAVDLEKFCAMIMQEYVLKANDLNGDAKQGRYHAAICKWIRGLAQAFIAQQNIYNYNEDIPVVDLINGNQDDILVLLGIPLPKFLAAYKAAHNLQGIPTPTINFNFQDELYRINGTTPLGAEAAPPGTPPAPGALFAPGNGALVIITGGNHSESQDDKEEEQEMIDATNAVGNSSNRMKSGSKPPNLRRRISRAPLNPSKNSICNVKRMKRQSESRPPSPSHISMRPPNVWPP